MSPKLSVFFSSFISKISKMPYVKGVRRSYAKRPRKYAPKRRTRTRSSGGSRFSSSLQAYRKARNPFFQRGGHQHVTLDTRKINPFPQRMYQTLRYCETISLYSDNITGATGSAITFALNDIFDPNNSGAGHQPHGYDQMTPIYNMWTVYSAQVNIRVVASEGTSQYIAFRVSPQINSPSFVIAGLLPAEIAETPNCGVIDCGSGDDRCQWASPIYSIAGIQGCSKQQIFNDNTYHGQYNGSPNRKAYFSVGSGTYDATTGKKCLIMIELVYNVMWWNSVQFAAS